MKKSQSQTPKADQHISDCFRRAKMMTRTWTAFLVCIVVAGITLLMWFKYQYRGIPLQTLMVGSVGLSTGTACVGYALNVASYIGLNSACKCLKSCDDTRTKDFLELVAKLKKILILDTFIPPLKPITTPMYYKYTYQLKAMQEKLEDNKQKKTKNKKS